MGSSKGVKVVGSDVIEAEFTFDRWACEPVPIAHAVGLPIFVRRLSDAPIESNDYPIVRFMSDPALGLAPTPWQFGGTLGPAPVVVIGRSDGKPFVVADWDLLDDFESSMLDNGPRRVTKADFTDYLRLRGHHFPSSTLLPPPEH